MFTLGTTDLASLRGNGASTTTATGLDNLFQLQYQIDGSISNADYLVSRFGVAPLDIRIEALIYAQEGSLFIIPGPSFNPDTDDTLDNYIGANNNPRERGQSKGTSSQGKPEYRHRTKRDPYQRLFPVL